MRPQSHLHIKLFLLVALACRLISPGAYAQVNFHQYPFDISYYPFIQYDSNKIDFYGPHPGFDKFFARLDTLLTRGRGRLNIVYVGGSHIQADMLTGELRSRFQAFNGGMNAGRGFVYPYHLAHTNTPWGYDIAARGTWNTCRNVEKKKPCPAGMAGIMSETSDSLTTMILRIEPENDLDYSFDHLRIYHQTDSLSFDIMVDSSLVQNRRCAQDSGFTDFVFNKPLDSLKLTFVKTDSIQQHFRIYGMLLGNAYAGVMVHNLGINGAATSSFLRCPLFTAQLQTLKPDLVIFGLGINDAYGRRFSVVNYQHNYDSLCHRVLQANPDAAILFVSNNDSYYHRRYLNRNGLLVQQSMKKLAQKHHAACWDMFELMGGLNSIVYWEHEGLAKKDKIHFTRTGYILLGDLLFEAIIKAYGDYLQEQYISKKRSNNNLQQQP